MFWSNSVGSDGFGVCDVGAGHARPDGYEIAWLTGPAARTDGTAHRGKSAHGLALFARRPAPNRAHGRNALRSDNNVVFDLGYPRCRPCGLLSLTFLRPRAHGTIELHRTAISLNSDPSGVNLGASPQRFLD